MGGNAKKPYRYCSGERLPVEYLIFRTDPAHLEEYLQADHTVWTLGEALQEEFDHIPFLSKEVWVNENRPGEIHFIFVWESMEAYRKMGRRDIQEKLEADFAARFQKPYELLRGVDQEEGHKIYRYSRFERA